MSDGKTKALRVPGIKPLKEKAPKKAKEDSDDNVDGINDGWRKTCGSCDKVFGSRNELFVHLRRGNHVRHGEAPRKQTQRHVECTGCKTSQPRGFSI